MIHNSSAGWLNANQILCAATWSGVFVTFVLFIWLHFSYFPSVGCLLCVMSGWPVCQARTKTADNCRHFFSAPINPNGRPIIYFSSTQFENKSLNGKQIDREGTKVDKQFFSLSDESGRRSKHDRKANSMQFRRINFLCDNFAWILMACFILNKLKNGRKMELNFFLSLRESDDDKKYRFVLPIISDSFSHILTEQKQGIKWAFMAVFWRQQMLIHVTANLCRDLVIRSGSTSIHQVPSF